MNIKAYVVLCFAMAVASCGKDKADSNGESFLAGYVLDQDQQPIAGATVYLTGTSAVATSNSYGAFKLSQPTPADTNVVVAVQNPGYVKQTMRAKLTASDEQPVNFTLQKVGMSVPITLPAAGEAPVQVAADGNDGGAILGIPPNALIKSDGTVASGEVLVDLTYFHPRQPQSTMPIPLLAQNANGGAPVGLTTLGMADITITQGTEELQVAPGATLSLDFTAMTAHRDYVTDYAREPDKLPRLYSADKNTGLWVEEALLGSNKLGWDSNTNAFKAKLPHLSSWNIDNLDWGAGGCVQGTVLVRTKDGKTAPAGLTPVRVWFAGRDEVGFFDVLTNGSGQYCIEPGVAHGAPSNTVRYFVSGQNNPGNSSMCNPLPNYCSSCVNTTIAHDCQGCGLRDDVICNDTATFGNYDLAFNVTGYAGCNPRVPCTTGSSRDDLLGRCVVKSGGATVPAYQESCPGNQRFYATLRAGAHCGGACFTAETVTLGGPPGTQTTTTPPTTTTPGTPSTPVTPPAPKPCDPASKNTRLKGQSCIPTVDTCCPNDGSLVCQDYVCVPKLGK